MAKMKEKKNKKKIIRENKRKVLVLIGIYNPKQSGGNI